MWESLKIKLIVGVTVLVGFYIYEQFSFYNPMNESTIELNKINNTASIDLNRQSGCYEVGLLSHEQIFSDIKPNGLYKIEYLDKNGKLIKEIASTKGTGTTIIYSHSDSSNMTLALFQVPMQGNTKIKIRVTVLKVDSAFENNVDIKTAIYVNKSFLPCNENSPKEKFKRMNLIEMDQIQEKEEYIEIIEAIKNKDLNKFKEIIPNKYDVNEKLLVDRTPLEYAIYYKADEIIDYLVKNKAIVDYIDKQRKTPLYYAIKNNSIEVVRMLLEKGVDANNTRFVDRQEYTWTFSEASEEDLKGYPALFETVCNEQYEITEMLLKDPKVDNNEYVRTTNVYVKVKGCLGKKYGDEYTKDFKIDIHAVPKRYKNIPKSMERMIRLLEKYGAIYEFPQERKGYIERKKETK